MQDMTFFKVFLSVMYRCVTLSRTSAHLCGDMVPFRRPWVVPLPDRKKSMRRDSSRGVLMRPFRRDLIDQKSRELCQTLGVTAIFRPSATADKVMLEVDAFQLSSAARQT